MSHRGNDSDDEEPAQLEEPVTETGNHRSSNLQNNDNEQNIVHRLEHAVGEKGVRSEEANESKHEGARCHPEQNNRQNDVERVFNAVENTRCCSHLIAFHGGQFRLSHCGPPLTVCRVGPHKDSPSCHCSLNVVPYRVRPTR